MSSHPRPAVNPWVVTFVISLATFMEVLDTSIANVSLTHIAGGLAASIDESTWVLTTYLVANAIMMPISGWLGTVVGLKRYYMVCVALFTVSSFFCGMAPSLNWLIFFRILQGVGGAGMAPVVQAMLADLFPPEKRGLAFSVYGLSVVFAPAIGPTLGGWITDNYSWHWIFLINVPIGMISLVLTAALVSEPAANRIERERLAKDKTGVDWVGFFFAVVGVGCLEFFLDRGQREDWFSSHVITALAVIAGFSLVFLIVWELRRKNPIVDIPLLRIPNFFASFVTMFLMGFVLFGTTALLPQFMEQLLGYTSEQAGLALTAGGVVLVFLMPISGAILTQKFPARTLVVIGLTLQALSLFHMTTFNLGVTFDQTLMARVYQVLGIALIFPPLMRGAYDGLPPGKNSNASALINLARNLGGSMGVAISNTILAQRSQFHQARLAEHVSIYDTQTQSSLHAIASALSGGSQPSAGAQQEALGYVYKMVTDQASMLSYIDVFLLMGIGTVLAIPLAFLLRKSNAAPGGGRAAAH